MALDIKRALARKGFTSKQVAETLGVSTVSFSNMINGNPTVETLNKISVVIGCDVSELFEQIDSKSIKCPHCGNDLSIKIE